MNYQAIADHPIFIMKNGCKNEDLPWQLVKE